MSKFIPNSFQVPNALVDELLCDLSGSELKCYLLVVRKTVGWQKDSDAISISQFVKATGLSNRAVVDACDSLVKKGLLHLNGTGARGVRFYSVDLCKKFTSEKSSPVKFFPVTSEESSQVTSEKSSHTKDTIKNTPKKTHTAKKKSDQSELEARFEKFWSAYPRKVAKPKAKAAFLKHSPDDAMLEAMLNAITAASQRDDWARDDYRYCPHPTTWLNQQRWTDEPVQAPSPTPAPVTAPKPRTDIVSPERRAERVAMLRAAMIGKGVH